MSPNLVSAGNRALFFVYSLPRSGICSNLKVGLASKFSNEGGQESPLPYCRYFFIYSLPIEDVDTASPRHIRQMCISFERSPNISGGQCKLADLLPTIQETQGWRLIQEEIGESPEMRRTIAELLNSDDAMALTFHKGAILIYLVHWRLGKLTHQLLASHTPDACWVRAGWCCVERSENADMVLADGTDLKREQ